jgi:nucleoid-associated protein YgaU
MNLRDKYNHAIQTAKNFRMDGSAEERDGKLYFKGTVATQDEANKIWDAIKTVPSWSQEIVADVQARTPEGHAAAEHSYTVKAGDTLSKIAKEHLGDANAYIDIYNANRDVLKDPDKIFPGQVLKLPQHTHK